MNNLYNFLYAITGYRSLIMAFAVMLGILVFGILVYGAVMRLMEQIKIQKEETAEENLRNIDYESLMKEKKAEILREVVAPDGIDCGPNNYMTLIDNGKEIYFRTFTISEMPRRVKFANTFSNLFNFPNCTSSVFIEPLAEEQVIHKMDRHITILSAEYSAAQGDPNRMRKLQAQYADASKFAAEVESGDNRFFNVGFLFSLRADSLKELNKITSQFRSNALSKGVKITSCYSVQAEGFVQNAPFNHEVSISSSFIRDEAIRWHRFDKYAVSAIYNYTQTSFSHMDGVVLGRDMVTQSPVMFDIYDPSHDGFTLVIAGKTGSGKSATIKMMASRQVLQGFHFVAVDSQARQGMSEGEYAGLAELCDGINFQISSSSKEVMNIFEVGETVRTVKSEGNEVHEVRTLELSDKIAMVANIVGTMVRGNQEHQTSMQLNTYINRIIVDNITQMYKSFGIIDGDPDSLYTVPGSVYAQEGTVTDGRPLKKLPTITDFYKQLLISNRDNSDATLTEAYNIILMSLVDYVRELYYSKESCTFFSKAQYQRLRYSEPHQARVFKNDRNQEESVIEIRGIRKYFDGQSTIHISKDCVFTNIDISQLPDSEKNLARQVAIDFVNENFIKKNSENLHAADKLACIFDEAHEMFNHEYARKTLDGVSRTARKRNVSMWLSSQTIKEYDNYPETQAILKQAAVKFVFKQDYQDREYLRDTLGITDEQASYIVNSLGGNPSDKSDKNRHRGEVCIIDNKQVCFCKVDYRKKTEAIAVETDARQIKELFGRTA